MLPEKFLQKAAPVCSEDTYFDTGLKQIHQNLFGRKWFCKKIKIKPSEIL
jgi:hypothetical protein